MTQRHTAIGSGTLPTRRRRRLLTAEDLYGLPDDDRLYELARGVLVVREPRGGFHAASVVRIARLLADHVLSRRLGEVLAGDSGFVLERGLDTVRGPDVAFERRRANGRAGLSSGFAEGAPELAVEIRSPSDRRGDVARKVAEYLAAGSRLVWVVDPAGRSVTVHAPGRPTRTIDVTGEVDGGDVLPDLRCQVRDFFADA
jgi:Uma2 family endonuclease